MMDARRMVIIPTGFPLHISPLRINAVGVLEVDGKWSVYKDLKGLL